MPKKKVSPPRNDVGRTALMLRFDDDVYAGVKKLAEDSGISVNQLMHGIARWAIKNGRAGEPYNDSEGNLRERPQPGFVWFGKLASPPPDVETCVDLAGHYGGKPDDYDCWTPGQLLFSLDYTERRVVRDDTDFADERPASTRERKRKSPPRADV